MGAVCRTIDSGFREGLGRKRRTLLASWAVSDVYKRLLTIRNSSSSLFTLRTMAWVSLFVPFVAAYIWYAWRAMNRRPITREEIRGDDHQY